MSIYVTGDMHGSVPFYSWRRVPVDGFMHRLSADNFPEQEEMTKEDYVVICGDFGGVWEMFETKKEKEALEWLEHRPFTTLFVPGNHENYDRLTGIEDPERLNHWMYTRMAGMTRENLDALRTGYPRKEWNGGYVRELRPSVLMLESGYIFDIDGRRCFSFGGAQSHDIEGGILDPVQFRRKSDYKGRRDSLAHSGKSYRIHGISWWPKEMPSEEDMERGLRELLQNGNRVDFIFSHDAPSYVYLALGFTPGKLNGYFEQIKNTVQYKGWFFGHLHENRSFEGKDFLLYEQIIRIN